VVSGVRRVVLAGSPPALAALVPALDLAGVTRAPGRPLAPSRR